jgi:hypothetical protein
MFEKQISFNLTVFYRTLHDSNWQVTDLTVSRNNILVAKISRMQSQTRLSFQSPPPRLKIAIQTHKKIIDSRKK